MVIYTYSKARQNFLSVLKQAAKDGEVLIRKKDGQTFTLKPLQQTKSPLDIEGIDLGINTKDIIEAVRESRSGAKTSLR